jgi:hypothetical protein
VSRSVSVPDPNDLTASEQDDPPRFLAMIGLVAVIVAVVILVFFAVGYAFGRLFL